ncbi:MAG TPA: tRNA guanosine(34) transglycosylase Tgt [Pirellulales bacterium]|jgi:queuine tRNA-ribosyltransferase|nr:tRNA guanosine(34) transglycosylase Tgt [Pirellulales bacterium]
MSQPPFSFRVHSVDADCAARRSTFTTPHGPVEMPAFMPVGTQGTVKGLEIDMLRATGAQMILANTYHLALRPGEKIVEQLGGLHQFMGWDGPILTDSGGFQVFSLAANVKITEQTAAFRSHLDGNLVELSPERAVQIQEALGSDVAMVLDHVVALPNETHILHDAMQRSIRWAQRAQAAHRRADQAQFAIVQGGLDVKLRIECTEALRQLDFPGYAVGGLSVGEPPEEMYRILEESVPALPDDKPRYLMGVGRPQDLLEGIARGIDLFDCVLPTRNGRNAMAFTNTGTLRVRNQKFADDPRPLEEGCPCPACRRSRGYLRHLFMADEMLGPVLLTAHNITFYQRLLAEARQAIAENRFVEFKAAKLLRWSNGGFADQ